MEKKHFKAEAHIKLKDLFKKKPMMNLEDLQVGMVMPVRYTASNGIVGILFVDGNKVYNSEGYAITATELGQQVLESMAFTRQAFTTKLPDVVEEAMLVKDELIRRKEDGSKPIEPGN